MIHPSYTELIQAINSNSEDDDNTMLLNSRYSLVLATSKRARQLIAGEKPLVDGAEGKKALSVAIDEFYQGKVKILAEAPDEEEQAIEAQPEENAGLELSDESAEETEEDTTVAEADEIVDELPAENDTETSDDAEISEESAE